MEEKMVMPLPTQTGKMVLNNAGNGQWDIDFLFIL